MIQLTKHQKEAFNIIKNGIENDSISLLYGSAGTGKTTITKFLVKYLKNKKKKFIITTPTHKSLRVAYNAIGDKEVNFSTIHSFLRIKEQVDHKGRKFVPDKHAPQPPKVDVLIIDECSMLSKDLIRYIFEYENYYDHIVFIGDSAQLPPVDEENCDAIPPIFTVGFNYKAELTEIVRQAEDNPIIKNATYLRDCIFSENYDDNIYSLFSECTIIENATELIDLYSREMKKDKDIILGSFTNKTVDNFNRIFRGIDYIDRNDCTNLPKLIEGEEIVANAPYIKERTVVIPNNSNVTVNNFEIKLDTQTNLKIYRCDITVDGFSELRYPVSIVHEDSEEAFNKMIANYKKYALKALKNKNKSVAGSMWRKLYDLKDRYFDFKYKYSCTLHKLQGSTYDEIFLDLRDLPWYDNNLRYRLMYVGLTRTRNSAIILL